MVADFAKKRAKHTKKSHSIQKVLATLLVILIILTAITAFTEFKTQRAKAQKSITATPPSTQPKTPQFDFYSMLPNMKTAPPAPAITPPKIAISNTPKHYTLQVASFKDTAQANTLIAKLTLLGLSPAMQAYQQNHITWNRVIVGPFDTVSKAQKTQHFLSDQHINSLLIKQ